VIRNVSVSNRFRIKREVCMQETTSYIACNLCEAMCGLEISHKGNEIISIRGDRQDSFSRGHICPKAVALEDIYNDSDRLRYPMRRNGETFERISWEDAFQLVQAGIRKVQQTYGNDSVAVYLGNPNVHNYGSTMFAPLLARSLGTRNLYSATSVDQLPHHFAGAHVFGSPFMLPIPDIDRTQYWLVLGANPAASNGSLMSAPDVIKRLRAIQERHGRITVVDPRRTETALLADRHCFIQPGTDALFLLAIIEDLFAQKRVKPDRLEEFTDGIDAIRGLTSDFPAERVAPITGISAEMTRTIAREFADASSAVCYGRVGTSTQEFGALTQWLIIVLNTLTGNLDRAGGAMFTRPAFDIVSMSALFGDGPPFTKHRSRVRGVPDFNGEFPVAVLAEEMLTPGPGQIKAFITSAGNPVLSTPNGMQLDQALSNLEFMVSVDFYINETTRHADIILPPTCGLEHENYDIVFHWLAIRNTARYSPALFEKSTDALHDWEIFLELISRLGGSSFLSGMLSGVGGFALKGIGPERILDWALRTGPHGDGFNPFSKNLNLDRLKEATHGIDLGALEPCLPDRIFNKRKRIALAPEPMIQDLQRLRKRWFEPSANPTSFDLHLIGRRSLRSNNSWMHNYQRLVKGKDSCTLLIHSDDAKKRNLVDGEQVRVSSRVGAIEIAVEVTDSMMAGVVSIPHGWGHSRSGVIQKVASARPGVSVNDLTDELAIDELCGNAAFSGVPVRLEKLAPG